MTIFEAEQGSSRTAASNRGGGNGGRTKRATATRAVADRCGAVACCLWPIPVTQVHCFDPVREGSSPGAWRS